MVIPNVIDTNRIKNLKDVDTDFKVDKDVVNVCSTGRLVHQKGFDILIKEFSEVIKKNNKYHLYIIGDGDERDNLSNLIDELNMKDYITLTGKFNNPFNIMNKCDAFALTSRYEGQGMVVLEAKALGLDIVIAKHLEKYVEGIKGFDSVESGILKLKKNKNKKFDDLKSYNDNIKKMINHL